MAIKHGQRVFITRRAIEDWKARKESEAAKLAAQRAKAARVKPPAS